MHLSYVEHQLYLFFMFAISFALFSTALELIAKDIDVGDSRALNYQMRTSASKQ